MPEEGGGLDFGGGEGGGFDFGDLFSDAGDWFSDTFTDTFGGGDSGSPLPALDFSDSGGGVGADPVYTAPDITTSEGGGLTDIFGGTIPDPTAGLGDIFSGGGIDFGGGGSPGGSTVDLSSGTGSVGDIFGVAAPTEAVAAPEVPSFTPDAPAFTPDVPAAAPEAPATYAPTPVFAVPGVESFGGVGSDTRSLGETFTAAPIGALSDVQGATTSGPSGGGLSAGALAAPAGVVGADSPVDWTSRLAELEKAEGGPIMAEAPAGAETPPALAKPPASVTDTLAGAKDVMGPPLAAPAASPEKAKGILDSLGLGGLGLSGGDLAKLAVGAGGLGYSIFKGQQDLESTKALKDALAKSQADKAGLSEQGKQLIAEGDTQAKPYQEKGMEILSEGQKRQAEIDAGAPDLFKKGTEALDTGQKRQSEIDAQAPALYAKGTEALDTGQKRQAEIDAQAKPLVGQGTEYAQYLARGELPPAMMAKLETDAKGVKAGIISRYAQQGMPTDPRRNSSLQAELAAVDNQMRIQAGTLAQQLLTSGTQLTGAGTNLYSAGTAAGTAGGSTAGTLLGAGANTFGTATQAGSAGGGTAANLAGAGTNLIGAGTQAGTGAGGTAANLFGAGNQARGTNLNAGTSLINTGANLTNTQSSLLQALSQIDQTQTQNIGKAIANFTSALGGVGTKQGGVTINVPKAT